MNCMIFILLCSAIHLTQCTRETNHTLVMAYLIPWSGQWYSGPDMGPAILPALENVKKNHLIPGYEIEMHWADTKCDELFGMKMIMDLWLHQFSLAVISFFPWSPQMV